LEKDLFEHATEDNLDIHRTSPLAHQLRPKDFNSWVGHERFFGKDKPLRKWIENDEIPSLILWGPPGCGKTSLAHIISVKTFCRFEPLSAVHSGVKEIKQCVERAKIQKKMDGRKTILFIDEIHRFNKSQQDALLPHVEDGIITLIGATTENPSFELNKALLSRLRVLRLERLSAGDLATLIESGFLKFKTNFNVQHFEIQKDVISEIAAQSEGDARRALTLVETVGHWMITTQAKNLSLKNFILALEESSSLRTGSIPYDKNGEGHYNTISAYIKCIRDSDPHASIYYLARMLESGEDPVFIARRLVISASEDIGNADPLALRIALSAKDAVELLGMPECRISLAQATTYLAMAPKSNSSYLAIDQAIDEVKKTGALSIPMHLRNAPTELLKKEGYGMGYQYSHNKKNNSKKENHFPGGVYNNRFYRPKDVGYESKHKLKLDHLESLESLKPADGTLTNLDKPKE